ncbi:MAG TPA: YbaK/EbsC family protein [Candidatus Limnocylindrales bacterium]|nr:YbaK/EbsC family protein [Candidatus Limnocylindrales bacterium]
MTPEHPSVARVRAHAAAQGVALEVSRFAGTTRTATDAAREIGCSVADIVKSLAFVVSYGDGRTETAVALVSGDDRVDEARLREALAATAARRATADETKAATGFPIGGVAPFGHARPARVVVDRRLRRSATVWAAAGLPDAVFPIRPEDLLRLSGGAEAEIAARPGTSGAEGA